MREAPHQLGSLSFCCGIFGRSCAHLAQELGKDFCGVTHRTSGPFIGCLLSGIPSLIHGSIGLLPFQFVDLLFLLHMLSWPGLHAVWRRMGWLASPPLAWFRKNAFCILSSSRTLGRFWSCVELCQIASLKGQISAIS